MKKLLVILLVLIPLTLSATIYYCSPTGDDASADATNILTPWKTWNYAMNHVTPGDTVYFRGGVYSDYYSARQGVVLKDSTINGTYNNYTLFAAYPSDWAADNYPILDCSTLTTGVSYNVGIEISRVNYIRFKGLHIRNVRQTLHTVYGTGYGFYVWAENHTTNPYRPGTLWFENCVAHHVPADGFKTHAVDTAYFINCDAYACMDSLTTDADVGGQGTGFNLGTSASLSNNADACYIYLNGCRAWNCSDQGFALGNRARIVMENCWAINNGNNPLSTNTVRKGSGVKLWYQALSGDLTEKVNKNNLTQLIIRNSIFAYNPYAGINWTHSDIRSDHPEIRSHIYNNFIYKNIYWIYNVSPAVPYGYAIMDGGHTDTTRSWDHRYWNNVSYNNYINNRDNATYGIYPPDKPSTYNLFDIAGTSVTDLYFLSLDTTGMLGVGTRKADGSLPDTDFGKPSSTSPLIDAGTPVGSYSSMENIDSLTFYGSAPDIGWAEYIAQDTTPAVVFTTSAYPGINYALIGGNVFDDGGDDVTERGVCYSTSATPTIASDTIQNGRGTGLYITRIEELLANTKYYVRAYAINQYGTSYGNELNFTTLSPSAKLRIVNNKTPLYHNGKPVWIGAGELDTTILVTSIDVTGTGSSTTIEVDEGTLQMLAEVLPANATNKNVTWSVINRTGTATISATGLLTATTDGIVTTKATAKDASGISDTLQITISNQSLVTSINVAGAGGATTITVDGGTLQMYADVSPDEAADTTITWSRINGTGTGTLSSTGLLTALSDGTVTVRATANDGSGIYGEEVITLSNQAEATQIIADHTIVDRYDDIPAAWIDSVKKMWLSYAGESHSGGIREGLLLLEAANATYAVSVVESGTPEGATTSNLRASRATWGDYSHATTWIYNYGEEDWWTNTTAVSRTKAHLDYCDANIPLDVFAFGWCWDHVSWSPSATADGIYGVHWSGDSKNGPEGDIGWGLDDTDSLITGNSVDLDTYLEVTQEYIDYCTSQGYDTKVIFTTPPVDGYTTGELRWEKQVKCEHIRDYVDADASRILFDYADILCYDDDGTPTTGSWNGNTYYYITATNYDAASDTHISDAGEIRLAKAMWWLLARIAGWDGN